MLQMLAEQVHWISPKHIYSSTAFQKAYPRRRQSCQPSMCATGRQQPGSTHELLRKDEKSKRHQPSPGTGALACDFAGDQRVVPSLLSCIPTPGKSGATQDACCHPPHLTHIPEPSPHPSSVSAAPNTCTSTGTRSKDDPTTGPQDLKTAADY